MKDNKIKLITEILAIVVIVLVSFVGVYKQEYNIMENKIKEYKYSTDLEGYREIVLEVSSEEKAQTENDEESNKEDTTENSEDDAKEETTENSETKVENDNKYEEYKNSKKIIEKRLKALGVQDYTISQNTENGTIYIQIPENDNTDHLIGNLVQVGKFSIKDSEDESKVFLTNDNLKNAKASYNTSTNGTVVFLQFEFNKDGKKILKDISSNEYKTKEDSSTSQEEKSEESSEEENVNSENQTSDTSTENTENNSEEKNQKKVVLSIDESSLITTSFDDVIENGAINLSMNQATNDTDSINDTLKSASTICSILNSGEMPLTYEVKQNTYVQTDISKEHINKAYIAIGAILAIVRYTNVLISIEGIVTAVIILAMNYLFVYELLKMDENTKTWDLFKSQILKAIPIVLIGVIFAFTKFTKLSTCGMFIFWGVTLSFIYNYILTINMIKQIRKGANINEE